MVEGYPPIVILVVLGLGGVLAFVRPYAAFLFALLILTAGDVEKFNRTRLLAFGPYLNLTDACAFVALVAFFSYTVVRKRPIKMPQIVSLMLFVLGMAAVQSFYQLGWTYETIRALRWAVDLPLALFLGANLVNSQSQTKALLGVLLVGALLAAMQHVLFVVDIWRTKSLSMETFHLMRTIVYWAGCMPAAFLLTASVWRLPAEPLRKVCCLVAGLLLFATIFLNQTRSLWIAMAVTIPCLQYMFGVRHRVLSTLKFGAFIVILLAGIGLVGQRLMPGLNVFQLTGQRIVDLSDKKVDTATRERALRAEVDSWLHGTLLFGRGLYFCQTVDNPRDADRYIAFGHLAYVTYLSQTGLVGLVVYALCLPLAVVREGRRLWGLGSSDAVRYVGLLGTASITCFSIMFIMGAGFLGIGHFAPGVLYGATWALARSNEALTTPYCL